MYFTHKKKEEQTHKPVTVRDDISTQILLNCCLIYSESCCKLKALTGCGAVGRVDHAHLYGVYKQHYNMQKSLDVNRISNVDSIKPLTDVGDAEPKCMVVFSWALITMGG